MNFSEGRSDMSDKVHLLPPTRGGWVVVYHEQPGPGFEAATDTRSGAYANPTDARERALELNAVSKWGLHTVRYDKYAFVNQEK